MSRRWKVGPLDKLTNPFVYQSLHSHALDRAIAKAKVEKAARRIVRSGVNRFPPVLSDKWQVEKAAQFPSPLAIGTLARVSADKSATPSARVAAAAALLTLSDWDNPNE